ncbi:MAG TPA: glycosyltransferase N-terminal domain-containing protein, partial [Abditibacterium sp.]
MIDPLFSLLNAAQTIAAPVLLLKKWRRFRARGDKFEWDLRRWNPEFAADDDQNRPHLVIVAMGFAETRLAARLTAMIQEKRPDIRVTWSIRNLEAAHLGGAIPSNQAVAPFPFDYFVPVDRWISQVQPDAVVFIERFQFPIFARALHNRGVQVAAVAARSRSHRGGRYRVGAFYAHWFLSAFDLLCFRSDEERENLGSIPAKVQTRVTGSLKFWPQLPPIEPQRAQSLNLWLQLARNRPILAAGSTQPGDEAWVFEAFSPLREEFGAVLLLAPRHVERADEVEALAQSRDWKVARRSRFEQPTENPDVLLLDSLGELTHAYGASLAAFVGGTIRGTGHNVLEPIAHGVPVFFGTKRGTFGAEQELCEAAGAGFR